MDPNRDSRYNLNYSMMMSENPEIYGNPNVTLARPPSGLGQVMGGRSGSTGNMGMQNNQCGSRGVKRGASNDCYDERGGGMGAPQMTGLEACNVTDVVEDNFTSLQPKKSPPSNGKKTKGRVKIKMEYIDNKLRRYTTFSKRKTGIMKKAYELSTLTGTQVMLLVASETGHVYTFATRKLQPMITSEAGKALIQTCLNSPDPPNGATGDQRMSATGYEETELSYNVADEDSKDENSGSESGGESDETSGGDSPGPSPLTQANLNNFNGTIANSTLTTSATTSKPATIPTASMPQLAPVITAPKNVSPANNGFMYPAALSSIPPDVLLNLVQSGQLQLHSDGDGGHQFITVPLSLVPSTAPVVNIKQSKAANGDSGMKDVNVKTEIND